MDWGGHDGAQIVGRIDSVSRRDDGVIWGEGLIDLGSPAGREIARRIAAGFAGGVSLDLDSSEAAPVELDGTTTALTTSARVRGATIVDIPASADARIQLVGSPRPGAAEQAPAEADALPITDAAPPRGPEADDDADPDSDSDQDCGCGQPEPAQTTRAGQTPALNNRTETP